MNTNTRYILTATAVAGGLFFVGATANAIVGGVDSGRDAGEIGEPVVLPSSAGTNDDSNTTIPSPSPEVIEGPVVNLTDDDDDQGDDTDYEWTSGSGSGSYDDDDDEYDDHGGLRDDDESDDDDDEDDDHGGDRDDDDDDDDDDDEDEYEDD